MLTQTKIAICVAIAVGIAVLPTTHAFAGNAYDSPDWAPPSTGGMPIGPRRLVFTKAMPKGPLRGGAGSATRAGSQTRREGVTGCGVVDRR